MHALTNISRDEGNQINKISQLIENNKRNILFFKKYVNNWGSDTSSRPLIAFLKS